jgi:hypothetical protein
LMTQAISFPRVANAQFSSGSWVPTPICSGGVDCGFGEEGESEQIQQRPRNNNRTYNPINSSPQPNRSRFNRTRLGTSAERLVGHWFNGLRDHLYISAVNSDGIGSSILTKLGKRVTQYNRQYKLVIYQGALVTIQVFTSDVRFAEDTYQISGDGQELSSDLGRTFRYVDSKTKP